MRAGADDDVVEFTFANRPLLHELIGVSAAQREREEQSLIEFGVALALAYAERAYDDEPANARLVFSAAIRFRVP